MHSYGLADEGFGEVFVAGLDDFLLEAGLGDFLLEGFLVGLGVEGEFDGLTGPGGVKGAVGDLDGINPLRSGNNEGGAIENGFDEILHDGGVLSGSVFEGDIDMPKAGAGEAGFGGFAEIAHGSFVAGEG